MSFEAAALLLAWVAITVLAFAMSGLLRQVHALRHEREGSGTSLGPSVGGRIPPIDGASPANPRLVLLFADRDCSACRVIVPEFINRAHADLNGTDYVVLLSGDDGGAWLPLTRGGRVRILLDQREAFRRYRIPVTPFGVIANGGVVIASEPLGSEAALWRFLQGGRTRTGGGIRIETR